MKKYNFVYQTKNLINGKTYIGVHQTDNLNDGYIGSGIKKLSDAKTLCKKSNSMFARAVVKYGYENFKKEILGFYDTYEECLEEEKYLVDIFWIQDKSNYNIVLGGMGRKGWKMSTKHKDALTDAVSKEYVVVNLQTNEIYEVKNLTSFAKKQKILPVRLHDIAKGKKRHYKQTWWVCYKEDWTGSVLMKSFIRYTGLNARHRPSHKNRNYYKSQNPTEINSNIQWKV